MAAAKKGKFFAANDKETGSLRMDLNSPKKEIARDALRRVLAMQASGNDPLPLFNDIVRIFNSGSVELKKLAYLIVINMTTHNSDKLADLRGALQRDARDPNAFMRALALRTMTSIKSPDSFEAALTPLKDGLRDKDPYVRKTAAVGLVKLYQQNKDLAEKEGFVEKLRDLISDPNPMVVSNAVAGLSEIADRTGEDVFEINAVLMNKLLAALNESSEWGQVAILEALSRYRPAPDEAATVIERVTPRLQHANSAVSMGALRVVINLVSTIDDAEQEQKILREKLPPPLITLLSDHQPELQFVALRNITLVVQKWPEILQREVKQFFCKYNDPSYIKMEKVRIMTMLAAPDNVDQVLMELSEYAKEVDVAFVRKSVRAIGRVAIRVEGAAERAVKVLLDLIHTKVNYVVQESVIVVQNILRRFPGQFESVISSLCENLDSLDEPGAKASLIWVIGEYSARIENVPALLEDFIETFPEEDASVQLQLVTAVVKFFLRRPDDAKDIVTQVLKLTTDLADNPDLRDRGFIYWRLLSHNAAAAHDVVLAERPPISDTTYDMDASILDVLIANLTTVASVFHKPPEKFVKGGRTLVFQGAKSDGSDSDSSSSSSSDESSSSDDDDDDDDSKGTSSPAAAQGGGEIDFLGDLAGDLSVDAGSSAPSSNLPIVLPFDNAKCKGLQVRSGFARERGAAVMKLFIENQTGTRLERFALKFNKNFYGVQPAGQLAIPGGVAIGGSGEGSFPIGLGGPKDSAMPPSVVQVAIKTDAGVGYFKAELPATVLFQEDGKIGSEQFLGQWKQLGAQEATLALGPARPVEQVESTLTKNNVFIVARRSVRDKGECIYAGIKCAGVPVLVEVAVGQQQIKGAAKSADPTMSTAALQGLATLF